MKKKNKHIGSDFEDFLKEENIFDEVDAVAIKRVLAMRVQKELKKKHITKTNMAKRLHTSRSSLDRLLDPKNTAITLKTIVKIAHILNSKIQISITNTM